jgi:hypothetical protein
MKKQYKNFIIETRGKWISVFINSDFCATVPTEEEARRVIWLKSGKGEPITDEMMEVI